MIKLVPVESKPELRPIIAKRVKQGDDFFYSMHQQLQRLSSLRTVHSIYSGAPHAVVFVPDADQAMVQQRGKEIRWR